MPREPNLFSDGKFLEASYAATLNPRIGGGIRPSGYDIFRCIPSLIETCQPDPHAIHQRGLRI